MNIARISRIAHNRRTAQDIYDRMPIKEQGTRCITAVCKMILLAGNKFHNGELYEPHSKSLGCGVYHVWYDKVA